MWNIRQVLSVGMSRESELLGQAYKKPSGVA